MTGSSIIPFQRNEALEEKEMKFWVTMIPHTRKHGLPIEAIVLRKNAQQALYDAIRSTGLHKQEEFFFLEMLYETAPGTWRVAYFNTTRSWGSDFDNSLPVRKSALPVTDVTPASKEAISPTQMSTLVADTEDDYKEFGYEVSSD